MKNRLNKKVLVLLAAALVLYLAVALVLPTVKNAVFAFTLLCTAASFCGAGYVFLINQRRDAPWMSRIFGWPVTRAALTMLAVQLGVSIILIAAAEWIPIRYAALAEIAVLCASVAVCVSKSAARDMVEQQETAAAPDTRRMKRLRLTVKALAASCPELRRLSEQLDLSDPVDGGLAEEAQLEDCIRAMEASIQAGEIAGIAAEAAKAERLLALRNAAVKQNKNRA